MKHFWLALCAAALPVIAGCEPGDFDSNYRYPPSSYDRYPPSYDRGYDYDRNHYDRHDRDRCSSSRCGRDRDRDHYDNGDRYHPKDHDYRPPPPPPPPPPPRDDAIRPSCPPNTTFDGRHCIVPEGQRRKGGKGTINACPQGMYLSGDRCVPSN